MIGTCAGALVVRDCLVRALAGRAIEPADVERLCVVSATSWRLFLDAEGCAAVAQQKLGELEVAERLADDVRAAIRTRSLAETQRVLSVRSQIAGVARIAGRMSWRIAVLKGGVHVAESSDVLHIADLDILCATDVAAELAKALRATGYREDHEQAGHHLQPITAGGVPIEIHRILGADAGEANADWWSHTRKLRQCPPLERPGSADHLWHLLVHSAEVHADRRGRLRDALLMWRAAANCDQSDMAQVESRITAHANGIALARALAFARHLTSRESADHFRARAAARYVVFLFDSRVTLPSWIRGQLSALTLTLVDGPGELAYYARRMLPSVWRGKRRADEPFGGVDAVEVESLRVLRRISAQVIVAVIAPFLAFLARRAVAAANPSRSAITSNTGM